MKNRSDRFVRQAEIFIEIYSGKLNLLVDKVARLRRNPTLLRSWTCEMFEQRREIKFWNNIANACVKSYNDSRSQMLETFERFERLVYERNKNFIVSI